MPRIQQGQNICEEIYLAAVWCAVFFLSLAAMNASMLLLAFPIPFQNLQRDRPGTCILCVPTN